MLDTSHTAIQYTNCEAEHTSANQSIYRIIEKRKRQAANSAKDKSNNKSVTPRTPYALIGFYEQLFIEQFTCPSTLDDEKQFAPSMISSPAVSREESE